MFVVIRLVPCGNCCCLGTCSVYTSQPCTNLQHHCIQSHLHMVHVLVHNLQPAGRMTGSWGGMDTKGGGMDSKLSQHRQLTLEKNLLLLSGIKPVTFSSPVWHSAIAAPSFLVIINVCHRTHRNGPTVLGE